MAKIECPNCKQVVPVRPPLYRCGNCDYPLNKNAQPAAEKINIDIDFGNESNAKLVMDDTQFSPDPKAAKSSPSQDPAPIPSGPASATPKVELVENPNPVRRDGLVAGWLILHTEGKNPVSYELFVGDNFFGTRADGFAVDIPVEGDKFVSRCHANISITKDFLHRFHYELLDNGSRRPQGPSTNGTFINGNPKRLPKDDCIYLRDSDTIQVGETKLVFKNVQETHDLEAAATEVLQSDYTQTIILAR